MPTTAASGTDATPGADAPAAVDTAGLPAEPGADGRGAEDRAGPAGDGDGDGTAGAGGGTCGGSGGDSGTGADRGAGAGPGAAGGGRSEAHAAASAVAAAVADGVGRIERVHEAVARRSWRPVGAWGAPSKLVHDLVAGVAYASTRAGVGLAGTVAAGALDAAARAGRLGDLTATPAGVAGLAVLDALAGDHLAQLGSPLALPMTIRLDGRPLALDDGTAVDVPDATDRIVVFLHGLAGWEGSWWGRRRDGEVPRSYGDELHERLGVTSLYVRYNTGRRIADNGADLAETLDRLVAAWPVPPTSLTLVGHSMGGLVIRAACHAGAEPTDRPDRQASWTDVLDRCIYLGTPHLGAPLARAAVALGSLLVLVPELAPFARLLERPSAGIRDLRFGRPLAVGVDEATPRDWFGRDLAEVPLHESVDHHAVSATLVGRPGSLVDRVVGDLLVLTASARSSEPATHVVVSPAHHMSLLRHPVVLEHLEGWIRA